MTTVIVAEDDPALRRTLVDLLTAIDMHVLESGTVAGTLELLGRSADLMILDLQFPDGHGRLVLEQARRAHPQLPVIVASGEAGFESIVEMIQRGAYDYLTKPIDLDALLSVLDRALTEAKLWRELEVPAPADVRTTPGFVSRSPAMQAVFKRIAMVAKTEATVLVTGETGVGKELVARAIHHTSDRRSDPFVAVNCATLSFELLSSELFGHARGAFTGAVRDHMGRFELAGEGTLFLDEVGELDASLQTQLLRVLQERTFTRVGESTPRAFVGRLVAATNRSMQEEIAAGRFRADLYYRLGVVEIELPPLRDRLDDIPPLVESLLPAVAREAKVRPIALTPAALRHLTQHDWPGNVRELRNTLLRLTVMTPGGVADVGHLERTGFVPQTQPRSVDAAGRSPTQTLASLEAEHIARVLEATGWGKRRAAEILGISRPTLDRKIKRYNLEAG